MLKCFLSKSTCLSSLLFNANTKLCWSQVELVTLMNFTWNKVLETWVLKIISSVSVSLELQKRNNHVSVRYSYMCMQSRIPSKELRVLYTWETCTHKVIMQDTCLLHTTLNSSTPEALGVSTIPATFQRTHKPTIWKLHSLDFYHLTPSQLACKLHLIKRQKERWPTSWNMPMPCHYPAHPFIQWIFLPCQAFSWVPHSHRPCHSGVFRLAGDGYHSEEITS